MTGEGIKAIFIAAPVPETLSGLKLNHAHYCVPPRLELVSELVSRGDEKGAKRKLTTTTTSLALFYGHFRCVKKDARS